MHTLACSMLVTTRTLPSTTPGQHGVPFKTFGSEDASACGIIIAIIFLNLGTGLYLYFSQHIQIIQQLWVQQIRPYCSISHETFGRLQTLYTCIHTHVYTCSAIVMIKPSCIHSIPFS